MKIELKNTLRIALPIILGNVTQMALGLIDSAMVGAIDYLQLAASALVTNVIGIPMIATIGLTMALSPLIAIANGQGNIRQVSHTLFNGVILCTIIATFIAIGIYFSNNIIYHLGQDKEVVELAIPYLKVMGWSLIPMVFFLSMKQFCDALEMTKIAMFLSLMSLPVNVFLNWLLIFGHWGFPRMELEGAGIATLITRVIMAIVMLVVILKYHKFQQYIAIRKEVWVLRKDTFFQILKLGIPSAMQYGMEVGAFSVAGIIIGWFGATQQAAHQIAMSIASFTFMIIFGLSTAGSIRVSNAYGRGEIQKMKAIGFSTLILGATFGTVFALFFVIFHGQLPYIFNQDTEVVILAGQLLLFAAVFQISDSTQAIGVGLLRGIKDVKVPTISVSIAYWVIGLPFGYFLGVQFKMEAFGIWIGLVLGLTVSSILMNLRFYLQIKKMELQKNHIA
ncbi:MAG: MATE family efflux transporter [Chitinophagales bacterium]|nr:MATE family efflux transporter [Chitinophagales bacterium]